MFLKRKTKNIELGKHGEDIAADYLIQSGYSIITRNYRRRFGEVDIVARQDATIVFVEVKTRRSAAFGTGFEAVDVRKQRQLTRIAQDYLSRHNLINVNARFDVVAVQLANDGTSRIEIITNAFESTPL
ncbi:YraN family protein [Desulfogranum marinum]|uniref:YraN family protein n=1 Tax=Desulfogranum marinum TaxID=453220 RepID=UPI0019650FF6|nr:YraN family protein [Desulfogranum marinum]MBM9510798.1 YraN family protein [Desulfogranum marinum]